MITGNYSQNFSIYNYKYNGNKQVTLPKIKHDCVSFTGHAQAERIFKRGFKQLIHQTAFDRESETKEFVCNYIIDNFGHKDKIRIISGGCSTGEEAVTYSMRLYNMRNNVDILGIDLGKDAIKQANSRKYIFETPSNNFDFYEEFGMENPYTDAYLLTKGNNGLTAKQQNFKALFNEFFEPTGRKIKTPFAERFRNQMIKRNNGIPLELNRVEYKLKDGMAENIRFVQGDINDIDKYTNGEKVDVISFCNSLYHLTTKGYDTCFRYARKDNEKIIEKLMTKFKECLNENGIVVFGEDEGIQLMDTDVLPRVMTKLGFTPLNETEKHSANVWKRN